MFHICFKNKDKIGPFFFTVIAIKFQDWSRREEWPLNCHYSYKSTQFWKEKKTTVSSWERVIKLENGSKKLFDRLLREHKHLLATADLSLFRSMPPTFQICTIYKYGGNRCSNILLESTLTTLIEVAIEMIPAKKIYQVNWS